MENQKNGKGVIALLVVIIIILFILCILLATGTINFKSSEVNNGNSDQNVTENNDKINRENSLGFGGEYVYELSTGAKVYTDYTKDGSFYYKRVEADNSVTTYGYGVYAVNENVLSAKIVFGVNLDNNSIVKSVASESTYIINDDSIEYNATGTSGQNHTEEKKSDDCNIVKEVTSYLYSISKNNEYKNNFVYE